jgi:hypothetical protein
MRNLLRNRKGSIAFTTVIAMLPVVGFVALGGEAAMWYVTKQHAQNAADAAAYSGGLTLACLISGSSGSDCDHAHTYVVAGEQFAAQNGFCNSGATYPGCTGTLTQTVAIDRGTFAGGAFSVSASGSHVRAMVNQTQPTVIAALFVDPTVTIGAQAIVEVQNPKDVCAIGLGPATNGITIGGSSLISGDGCALMSNTAAKFNSEPEFVGSNWAVNSSNGCSGGHCDVDVPHNYSSLPATNPLKVLDTKSWNGRTGNTDPLSGGTGPGGGCPSPLPTGAPVDTNKCYVAVPNSSGSGAYKGFTVSAKEYVDFSPGTYFFYNAAIKINGGYVTCSTCTSSGSGTGKVTVGVTFVLLGDSSVDISGGTVKLFASTTNTFDSSLNGILIDDQAPTKSSNNVSIGGGSNVQLGGVMYFPNVEVTWNGTTENPNMACTQVIANAITITGNSYLSSQECGSSSFSKTQVVALVK